MKISVKENEISRPNIGGDNAFQCLLLLRFCYPEGKTYFFKSSMENKSMIDYIIYVIYVFYICGSTISYIDIFFSGVHFESSRN